MEGQDNSALPEERFVIKERLGSGGMGVVYRAYDRERHCDVALKTLRKIEGAALYRFKREFRALSDLVHPNLVTLYELASTGSYWFFTMELIEGVSFIQHVRPYEHFPVEPQDTLPTHVPMVRRKDALQTAQLPATPGPLAPQPADEALSPARRALLQAATDYERLRSALRQLVVAVDTLHRVGKLHRDLKPSNVLVGGDGRVVLCDFGLIAEAREADRTGENHLAGTPTYMAPEQAAGQTVTEASDWYAVGVMLYEALTGRVPFGGSAETVMHLKQTQDPTPLQQWAPAAPDDLAQVAMALLSREAGARPRAPAILDALGETAPATSADAQRRPSFVGRSAELAELHQALADSRTGKSVAVFVHASSGMGKTELCQRFLGELDERGDVVVLQGRCYERESVPYKALDALVDALSSLLLALPDDEVERLLPRDIGPLSRLFPVLMRVRAVAEPRVLARDPPDPQESRRRAFGALRYLLRALAEKQPVVLFLDDLQWGDLDSAAFFVDLIDHPDPPPVLWVATYRREEVDTSPLLRSLLVDRKVGQRGDRREIALDAMNEADARELVSAILSAQPDGAARADAVIRESRGSPFFLCELAHAGVGQGGKLRLDTVVQERVNRLPEEARELLRSVAVAGRPVAVSVASRVAGIRDWAGALATLQAGRLVRTRRASERELIETYHDRIRETVTGGMIARDLEHTHRRLARALETEPEPDALALVEHWMLAGDRDKAGRYASRAAGLAEAALAFDRAAHYYAIALELQRPPPDRARELRGRIGDALANAGRLEEAATTYLTAAQDAPRADAVELRRRAVEQLLRAGKREEGLEHTKALVREVGISLPRSSRSALLSVAFSRAWIRLRGYNFDERTPDDVPPETRLEIDTAWSLSSGLSLVDPMLGTAFQMRHLLSALRAGAREDVALALAFEISYRAIGGTSERSVCDQMIHRARSLGERMGDVRVLATVWGTSGVASFLMGDWREACERLARSDKMLRDQCTGMTWEIDTGVLFRMGALLYHGELAQLTQLVPLYLREADARGNQYLATGLRSWRSNAAWLILDDAEEAQRQIDAAESSLPLSDNAFHLPHYYRLLARVQIELYRGDALAAWQRMEAGWRWMQKSLLTRIQTIRIEGAYLRARAALAAAAAVSGAERKLLLDIAEQMARRLSKERLEWGNALCQIVRGCVHALRGQQAEAQEALGSAASLAEAAHMALFAAVARRRRGELIGGDSGKMLIAGADDWMGSEGVGSPARMTAMFAPL